MDVRFIDRLHHRRKIIIKFPAKLNLAGNLYSGLLRLWERKHAEDPLRAFPPYMAAACPNFPLIHGIF